MNEKNRGNYVGTRSERMNAAMDLTEGKLCWKIDENGKFESSIIKLREARCLVNSFCQNGINWHLCAVFPSLREDMSLDWFKVKYEQSRKSLI